MEKQEIYHARNRKHAQAQAKKIQQRLGFWTHKLKNLYRQEEFVWCAIFEEHEKVLDRKK